MSSRRVSVLIPMLLAIAAGSCNVRPHVIHPTFPDGGMLRDATPLPQTSLEQLEGLFKVNDGQELLGHDAASRASPGRISFFGPNGAIFAILEAGCLDEG